MSALPISHLGNIGFRWPPKRNASLDTLLSSGIQRPFLASKLPPAPRLRSLPKTWESSQAKEGAETRSKFESVVL